MNLILASTSPHRRALMERLGIPFGTRKPPVDEGEAKLRGLSPQALAENLARAKADSVSMLEPHAVVIGSDQVAEVGGRILDKPGSIEAAEGQLRILQGRDHRLFTAVSVLHKGRHVAHTDVTILTMRTLGDEAISRYVHADRPLECAGSYKLESRGITLFERIESHDHSAIVGLPLVALTTILLRLGFVIP